jgi:hypothetical protein
MSVGIRTSSLESERGLVLEEFGHSHTYTHTAHMLRVCIVLGLYQDCNSRLYITSDRPRTVRDCTINILELGGSTYWYRQVRMRISFKSRPDHGCEMYSVCIQANLHVIH